MKKKQYISCWLFLFLTCLSFANLFSQSDPLPSWNNCPAKQAILEFVNKTCDSTSASFVPPANRIATFDQDGTLWVEHPIYTQAIFALDRVKVLAKDHPQWKEIEPFKAILSGDSQAIAKFKEEDWARIIAVTHTGMSTEEFYDIVKNWLSTAKNPRFNRLCAELIYQPMVEVMDLLRQNSYKTYIVTGGGQEFVRVYSQPTYGIPPEHIIGSCVATKYELQDGKPILLRLPKVLLNDNYAGKAEGINLFIGKRPYAAFGNSDGDREMLEWTQAGDGTRLMMLVHHDDPNREYAYGPAGGLENTSVGTFSDSLMSEAQKKGWIVVSMKNDWKKIFSFEK
jgi:phosphoglycolate phosphatase-like HAD superfamily hydrolase